MKAFDRSAAQNRSSVFSETEAHETVTPRLIYSSHRTTKTGSLILSFIDPKTDQEFVVFFNVDVRRKRGKNKGESYRTGQGCRFTPKPRSKFIHWWWNNIGKPPRRWSEAYKYLRARLKELEFVGVYTVQQDRSGKPYARLEFIMRNRGDFSETSKGQPGDKSVTISGDNGSAVPNMFTGVAPDSSCTAVQIHNNTVDQAHNNTDSVNTTSRAALEMSCPSCGNEGCSWCQRANNRSELMKPSLTKALN